MVKYKVFGVLIIILIIALCCFFVIKQNMMTDDTKKIKEQIENGNREELYKNPYIPNGFRAVDIGEITWSKNGIGCENWDKGLVVEDESNGNQFVWVPVDQENVNYNNLASWGKQKIEISEKDKNQIDKYGGFYIARYECGVPKGKTEQLENISESTNDVIGVPVSQKGSKPWNYISFNSAKENAKVMYSNDNIQSEMISEAVWNLTMQWLRSAGYDVDKDSNSFGNYSDSYFSFSGLSSIDYGRSYQFEEMGNKKDENLIIATGSTDRNMTNNIYDLAGNVSEFVEGEKIVVYGGYYDNISKRFANSYSNISEPNDQQGFRVILYHN